jgi:hypothetical protein
VDRLRQVRVKGRSQTARAPSRQGGVDHHKIAVGEVEVQCAFAPPRKDAITRPKQPAVQVSDEHHTIANCCKTPGQLLRRIRWAVEIPEIFDFMRVKPRLNMREQAVVNFQVGPQAERTRWLFIAPECV